MASVSAIAALVLAGTWTGAGLLVLAGVVKVADPRPTGLVLERLGLSSPSAARVAARLLGVGEVTVGTVAITVGGAVAAGLVGLAYAALLGVAGWQRRSGVACGCFGNPTTVGMRHLAVNAGIAVAAAGAALTGVPATSAVVTSAGGAGAAAGLVLVGCAAWLVQLSLTQPATVPSGYRRRS